MILIHRRAGRGGMTAPSGSYRIIWCINEKRQDPAVYQPGDTTAFLQGQDSIITADDQYYSVKATFDGTWVRLGPDGRTLYDQSGYGRPEKDGLRLSPEEAAYLTHRNKIEIPGYDFDRLVAHFAGNPHFMRSFLVYRDIRERGYAVQTGPHDFRVFRRGQRPGSGQSQYMIRVLSERDLIDFEVLIREVTASSNMRKQHVLAVVDDENELTYYEIKIQPLPETGTITCSGAITGMLAGRSAIVHVPPGESDAVKTYGMRLDPDRLVFSSLEIICLMHNGSLTLLHDGKKISADEYRNLVTGTDLELAEKVRVYEDLRQKGYIPRTGYKFGHHFRVYSGQKVHSEMLIHALSRGVSLPMSTISRSVRLAHSVKKKMLFGCEHNKGISYVEFARIKL